MADSKPEDELQRELIELYPRLVEYLSRCRCRFDEDAIVEAISRTWMAWTKRIENGEASQMTPADRTGRIFRLAYFNALDVYRKRRRGVLGHAVSLSPTDIPADYRHEPFAEFDPFHGENVRPQHHLVRECLAEMDPDERSLLCLRADDHATYEDLAGVLGCTVAGARKRFADALDELRTLLIRRRHTATVTGDAEKIETAATPTASRALSR